MILMGIVRNYTGFLICRLSLGVAECGFFPGTLDMSCSSVWLFFYTASAFSGALSGFLAFGIARMNGLRGIAGWRWIFLVEGAFTVFVGFLMLFLIIDCPEETKRLSEDKK